MKSCIKQKKFLFWKYRVVTHHYKLKRISKFMSCSDTFHVLYECDCGAAYIQRFVEQDELILKGMPAQELSKVDDVNFYYITNEE